MVKFNLKEPKSNEPTLVVMVYWHGASTPFRYSTGQKIEPKYFDKSTYRTITKGLPKEIADRNETINRVLNNYQRELEIAVETNKRLNIITNGQNLKDALVMFFT
ncbi:MAG: hypothetical protein U0T69_06560 [Chitinophagales bacterium]